MRYCNRIHRLPKKAAKSHDDIVAHFQKRCLERIGIVLNQRELKQLAAENKLECIRKQSNSKTHFRLRKEQYNGKQLLQFDVELVYDKLRGAFVTVWKYGSEKPISHEGTDKAWM